MLANSRPAEFVFALALNLAIIAISVGSLSAMFPQFLSLFAKQRIIEAEIYEQYSFNSTLEQQLSLNKQRPQLNLKNNANLSSEKTFSLFWLDN